jgi:dinuclear metal center YbgI/SA1388 family protein
MKILEIIQHLEIIAPPEYQEDYDNSGLITGNIQAGCTGALICLDCTEDVISEAIRKKANLVICHHPLIFRPIRKIDYRDETGRTLIAAVKADISIYAIHTNLDNILTGVNARIADKLGIVNREFLLKKAGEANAGSGMIGDLKTPIQENQLLNDLKRLFNLKVVRYTRLTGKPVSRMAVCGGAGSFLIANALEAGAGFFISSDIKYHDFFGVGGKMVIADIGHFESEQFTVDLLHDILLEKFPNFAVLKSGTVTNPVNYYI